MVALERGRVASPNLTYHQRPPQQIAADRDGEGAKTFAPKLRRSEVISGFSENQKYRPRPPALPGKRLFLAKLRLRKSSAILPRHRISRPFCNL